MKFRIEKLLLPALLAVIIVASCRGPRRSPDKITSSAAKITDDSLLTLTENRTFLYFWDGAEPVSGMARERYHIDGIYPENDFNIVTTGGTGFGLMSIIVGMERKFITREQGFERISHIVDFLGHADRFHGAWPHWLYGETGRVKPFSAKDDGADIVETSYLAQGLLSVRQYFRDGNSNERILAARIDSLWRGIDWNFFTRGGSQVIYWHWSPDYGWAMNLPVRGYNECLITYVVAASSPTHPVDPLVYHRGWARNGGIVTKQVTYGLPLLLKHNDAEQYGGPLFWSHYSYLGLDPRGLSDMYADYWKVNVNQTLINYRWCIINPGKFKGYSEECWGLTASYSMKGYDAHAPGPGRDLGVISPTASISSLPYTPGESMAALRHFYYALGDSIFGKYGFYDAFSETDRWYPRRYLAIDQGPEVVMIENYRTGLLWNLFMSCPEIQTGLKRLGFSSPWIKNNNEKGGKL